ncbi:MAG TPA: ABC transporter permease [Bryobacteraceae bacterium]|nr:ABC transporter permease [Bryobacteraceae bacterium]
MSWWNSRRKRQADLDEEIAAHFRMAVGDRIDRGEAPERAHAAALREFGNQGLVKEATRETWGWGWLERFGQDLRYGLRMLRRSPGFTAVVALTLALGIGANTAIFSMIQAALNGLPIADPDRVFVVWTQNAHRGMDQLPVSVPDYKDMKAAGIFSTAGMLDDESGYNIQIDGHTDRIQAIRFTPEVFEVLGSRPQLGHLFGQDDVQAGSEPVIVLTDAYWHSRFGADPTVVGRRVVLDGVPASIIGVLPAKFPRLGQQQVYCPLIFDPAHLANRGSRGYGMIARLRPGLSPSAAQHALEQLASRIEKESPVTNGGSSFRMQSAEEAFVSDARDMLVILLAAVGFVLLIACANIANLLLARATIRGREMTIRIALGASRWRLACQLLSESILLALLGGLLAIVPAAWAIHVIAKSHFDALPSADLIEMNGTVLAFNLALAVVTGILFGTTPVLLAWKTDTHVALKTAGRNITTGTHQRLRGIFVVCEIALTLVLLVGAGLMLRSFIHLRWSNPGYTENGLLSMRLALSDRTYDTAEKEAAFYQRLLDRARGLPGIESIGAIDELPTSDSLFGSGIHFPDRSEPRSEDVPIVLYDSVTPDYFRAMQIPLVRGRYFNDSDRQGAPSVALVDEYTAQRYWPGQDVLGKSFKLNPKDPERVVVGVVRKVQPGTALALMLRNRLMGQVYLPLAQAPRSRLSLVARTSDPVSAASGIRAIVRRMDPGQPLFDVMSMEEVRAASASSASVATWLMGCFGILALSLATIGIYGVMSYHVGQRTREFGIRVSLGAQQRDILRLAARRGVALTATGIGVGIAGAIAVTRLMSGLLFGVTARDPETFGSVSALLAASALLACYVPARRATRIDPNTALREE